MLYVTDCPDVNAIRIKTTLPVALLIFSIPKAYYIFLNAVDAKFLLQSLQHNHHYHYHYYQYHHQVYFQIQHKLDRSQPTIHIPLLSIAVPERQSRSPAIPLDVIFILKPANRSRLKCEGKVLSSCYHTSMDQQEDIQKNNLNVI